MLLDTNAITSIAAKDPRASAVLRDQGDFYIPVFAYGEYMAGILGSVKIDENSRAFRRVLAMSKILDADQTTADWYAYLFAELRKKKTPIPVNDIWIAALARQHELPVMTQDKHFRQMDGIEIITW